MLRSLFLYLSRAEWAKSLVMNFPPAQYMSKRFVAGATLDEAIVAIQALNAKGILATLDHLGESVADAAQAQAATEAYLAIFDRVRQAGLTATASVKLTQLGLDISYELALSNMRRLLAHAQEQGLKVCIDMESSDYTERTLRILRTLREEYGFENVSSVIQSYLYRSEEDMRQLGAAGYEIRLCKGAYKEPPEVAFPAKKDVDLSYVRCVAAYLTAAAGKGHLKIATHDETMIEAAKLFIARRQIGHDRFEFQMLYGIRPCLQERLVQEGYQVRVYVPYGTEWYPYYMRRLAERPANLWFIISNLFKH